MVVTVSIDGRSSEFIAVKGAMAKRFIVRLGFLTTLTAMLCGSGGALAAQTLIVALGASSTAGKGVRSVDAYPAQLEALLKADGRDVKIVNAGLNGDTSSGMLARLDANVPSGTRIVILQAGTNDAGDRGHNGKIAEIVRRLNARSIKVVLFRTKLMRDLRANYSQDDGHHLTPEGYRILASRLRRLVERAIPN